MTTEPIRERRCAIDQRIRLPSGNGIGLLRNGNRINATCDRSGLLVGAGHPPGALDDILDHRQGLCPVHRRTKAAVFTPNAFSTPIYRRLGIYGRAISSSLIQASDFCRRS